MLTLKHISRKSIRYLLAVLIVISSITFHAIVHAQPNNEQQALEYRANGYAEQQKGNLVSALDDYSKALMLKPHDPAILNDTGVLYEQFGFQSKAEDYYLTSIEADQNYLPAYMNLGYLYLKEGYASRAFYYFKKRYELGKQDDPWTKKAKEEMLTINPEYDRLLEAKEVETLNQELASQGRNEFYNRIKLSSQHFIKGKRWLAQRQPQKAIQEFDAALVYTPQNPKVMKAREQLILEMTAKQLKKDATQSERYRKSQDLPASSKATGDSTGLHSSEEMTETMRALMSRPVASAKSEITEKLTTTPSEQFIPK